MNETQRLKQWIDEHGFDVARLAEVTGDSYSNVYLMTTGRRPINDGFRWRFAVAFGWQEASHVFDVAVVEPA